MYILLLEQGVSNCQLSLRIQSLPKVCLLLDSTNVSNVKQYFDNSRMGTYKYLVL